MGLKDWDAGYSDEDLDEPLTRRDFIRFRLDQQWDLYTALVWGTFCFGLGFLVSGLWSWWQEDETGTDIGWGVGLLAASWVLWRTASRVWEARRRLQPPS